MKKTITFFRLLPVVIIVILLYFDGNKIYSQSYLGLNGGFEGTATIDNTVQSAAQANKWTKNNATQTIADETTIVRSGAHSLSIYNSSTTGRRVWSPLMSVASQTTAVTIQYFRRVSNATNSQTNQEGVLRATESLQGTYDTPAANNWEKQTYSPSSATFTSITGVIMHKMIGTGGNMYIDDMCIYAGTLDETAPNAPTAGSPTVAVTTSTSLTISWTAPGTGTDNGGYLVVRGTSDPTTVPNSNGIYAVNNSIGTGIVVYQGTGTSFTDTGLTSGTPYYYRIYTYDKAYNYSSALTGSGTPTSAVTPTITLTPTSLTGFTYVQGSGPSTEKTFSLAGSNLSGDISLAASTNYEISKTSGSGYTTPLTFVQSSGSVPETTVYVRLKSGLSTGNFNSETLTATSSGADTKALTCSGSVTAPVSPEPTDHATSFTASTNSSSQITVTWTDATGTQLPDGYLVIASSSTPATPVDGTAQADATLVKNITQGTQQAVFTGLSASTTYNFSIWPYTNSGAAIDYKIGSQPTASATTSAESLLTYTWNQTGSAAFGTAANWTPARTAPASNDILIFDNGATTTVTGVSTQTIGGLSVSNGTKVTLNSSGAAATLTISNGVTGSDLSVASGCELNIAQTSSNSALIIALATGATGSVSGSMDFSSATATTPNQITSADASGLVFNSGAVFTQNTNSSSNVFGSGTSNSVVFANGSTFTQYGGSNPFQKTAPASVVIFQTGSLFKLKTTNAPAFNGRTYANFEYDFSGNNTVSGTSAVVMDNLTVTNGTFNFNMTATPGHLIKGNISVASGATLNFNPTSAGTINLNGTSTQTISGSGTLSIAANASFIVGNDVVADKNITFGGPLTINTSKSLTVNAGKQLTVSGTLTNNGTLNLLSTTAGTATLNATAVSGDGTANVSQYLSSARNWYVSSPVTAAVAPSGYTYYQRDEAGSSWTSQPFVAGNTFIRGKGYIALPGAAGSTLTFSGKLNVADTTVALTWSGSASKGFNLIGNPYPCHLTWTKAFTDANVSLIEPSIYYRTNSGTVNNSGQWSNPTYNAFSGASVGGATGVIPPMQAIWVRAVAAGNLALDNKLTRSHESSNPMKAPAVATSQNLRLVVSDGTSSDEMLVYFNSNASNAYDAYDSPKMINGVSSVVPDMYTMVGNEELVINGMSTIPAEIPLYIKPNASTSGQFSLRATEVSNFEAGTQVYIKNSKTGEQQLVSDGSVYSFDITADPLLSIIIKAPGAVTGLDNPTNTFNVYANAKGQLTVVVPAVNDGDVARVYNSAGQCILNQSLTNSRTMLNKFFTAGVYVVKVNETIRKVVIE